MKKTYDVSFFYFWGDTAVLRRQSMEEICDRIIAEPLNISWISNARPECVADLDFAKKLRRAGCLMLSMGAESGAAVRDTMHKKLNDENLHRAIRLLKQADIRTFVFFIFGYPGETRETMEATLRLALALDPDYANFYPAVPYPGTPLWRACKEQNLLPPHDWRQVDFTHYILRLPDLPPEAVMDFVRRARRAFYLRPRYMMKTLRDVATPRRMLELIKAAPAYFDL